MEADIQLGKFIETAEFSGNYYGTSVEAVKKVTNEGKICILEIDIQGAQRFSSHSPSLRFTNSTFSSFPSVKKTDLDARFVFVKPPTWEVLEQRLRGRGTESEEEIERRLQTAKKELDFCDNSEIFDVVIVNDDLKEAYTQLKEFAL